MPNTHEEIVDMFVRFVSMCPVAMVYTIVLVDLMGFKGIYSKENRYESYLLLSEEGKRIIKNTVVEDAICKNILLIVVGLLIGIISYVGFPDMYRDGTLRAVNIISIVFNCVLVIQFSTWVIRHFMNWAHMLWMMAFLYTFLIPLILGCSIAKWMNYEIVVGEIILAMIFSIINVNAIDKNIRKNWAKD